MKTILTAAALALALGTSAYAQTSTSPATPAAPAATAAPKVEAKPEMKAATPAAPAATKATSAVAAKPVNINTVPVADLEKLPKIGEARAKLIVAGRPYKTVDDLMTKKIIPQDAFDAVKSMVSVQ